MTPPPSRASTLARLASEAFDVLVVGGGATGAGIARDAALRGLRVALCEAGDFAGQTSSQSSKLIHGGLRYLQYGDLRLVFEGLSERRHLMTIAPHLCRPIEFLFPAYRGERPGLRTIGTGIALYNALALWRPAGGRSAASTPRETLPRWRPLLRSAGLAGRAALRRLPDRRRAPRAGERPRRRGCRRGRAVARARNSLARDRAAACARRDRRRRGAGAVSVARASSSTRRGRSPTPSIAGGATCAPRWASTWCSTPSACRTAAASWCCARRATTASSSCCPPGRAPSSAPPTPTGRRPGRPGRRPRSATRSARGAPTSSTCSRPPITPFPPHSSAPTTSSRRRPGCGRSSRRRRTRPRRPRASTRSSASPTASSPSWAASSRPCAAWASRSSTASPTCCAIAGSIAPSVPA